MSRFFRMLPLFPLIAFSQSDFSNAEKLFRQGNYEQSQTAFENFLKDNPNNLKTIEYLGDLRGISKDWPAAMAYYQKLKKLKPSEADYYYKYGGALGMLAEESNKFYALGMIGDIRESFEKAIQLDPKHIEARWALIEFYLQLPGIVGGSEHKATNYANELLAISPIDGWLAKGRISEYFDQFAKAEAYYKKAVEVGGSKTSYQKLADLYKNKMNQPEKAKAVLETYSKAKG
jgi:tetratricopeptide (TPR) repeat protein